MTRRIPALAGAMFAVGMVAGTLALTGCGKPAAAPVATDVPTGTEVAPAPRAVGLLDAAEKAKRDRSVAQCVVLENACKAFALKPRSNGVLPLALLELVQNDPARKITPVVDGGPAVLNDPWGKPYQYEAVAEIGRRTPKVWTTAPDGTTITSPYWADKSK